MEAVVIYGGDIRLSMDPVKHLYSANGEVVKGSISGVGKIVNKPMLIPWAVKLTGEYILENLQPGVALDEVQIFDLVKEAKMQHRRKTDSAADIGTMGHEWIKQYFIAMAEGAQPPSMPINDQLRNIVNTFLEWLGKHDIEVLEAERKLYSREHEIAGTVDCICIFDGKLTILDWKTGSGIYPEHFLQTGGYDICWTEEQTYLSQHKKPFIADEVSQHIIVNCSKTGELASVITDEVERNKTGFMAALKLQQSIDSITEELKQSKKGK